MPKKIDVVTAKIASLVADSQVALTAGESTGVQVGDEAVVERIVEVTDPDSGESLGTVRFSRVRLEIIMVSERFSVGRVTDREPSMGAMLDITRVRRLKKLTFAPFDEDENTVLLSPGEAVTVRRTVED